MANVFHDGYRLVLVGPVWTLKKNLFSFLLHAARSNGWKFWEKIDVNSNIVQMPACKDKIKISFSFANVYIVQFWSKTQAEKRRKK